jgi:AcrR family transcriptional regulator
MDGSAATTNRYDRKKATTRLRITAAGNELFSARGYDAVSMEDIAEAADLAVRTLYLHFESKAAILLAHFDDWLDAYVVAICARPLDEPIAETVAAALATMRAEGWEDDRTFAEMSVAHPVVEFIGGGNIQLAGHLLHSWVRAQDALVADARKRGGYPEGSLVPRARAAAHFAGWVATVLAFREAFQGGRITAESSHEIGQIIMRAFGEVTE